MGRGMTSRMWLLGLLLSTEMILAQSNKMPDFAVFVTPDLCHQTESRFCIHWSGDLQGYKQMTVELKTPSENQILCTVTQDSPKWHCPSFQVPEPSGVTEKATMTVNVYNSEGDKIECSSKDLTLRKKATGTLIQSDKSVYKRGQPVMFRMVTIDQDMAVVNKNYSLVEIRDPEKNCLAQYKDVSSMSGIAEGRYELSPDAALGKYIIKMDTVHLPFTVEEYVAPKFDVHTDCPSMMSVLDEDFPISVWGLYTYGEKVQGNVTLKVCQKKRTRYWGWWRRMEVTEDKAEDLCYTHNAKTDSSGILKIILKTIHFNLRSTDHVAQLEVEASLEEEGTEIKFNAAKKTIALKSQLSKLTFKDCKKYYQPGALYRGTLVLETYDGKRLSFKKVHLSIPKKDGTVKETYITDSAGEVSFKLDTSEWSKGSCSLRATTDEEDEPYSSNKVPMRYPSASKYVQEMYTPSKNSMSIRPVKSAAEGDGTVPVTVDYTCEDDKEENMEFCYLFLPENRTPFGGQQTVKKTDSPSGSLQFNLPTENMKGKLMVFMKSRSGGFALDTTEVQGSAALNHKVTLRFDEPQSLPGSDNYLHLKANGGSMCALRVVDKSVVMMKPEAELSETKIKNLVSVKCTRIYSQRPDWTYCDNKKPEATTMVGDSSDATDMWGGWSSYPEKNKDCKDMIEDMGMHILTSWDIVAPTTCKFHRYTYEFMMADGVSAESAGFMAAPAVMKSAPGLASPAEASGVEEADDGASNSEPRTLFPETWMFTMNKIPESGSAKVPVKVPDSITEWCAQMFCAGPEGLGLSPPVGLKAFKPFFVDLTCPYSMKRGESLMLKASVFNYMSDPMMISTSLLPSDQFISEDSKTSEKHFCLLGGVKKTVYWPLTPTEIGQMNITVMAEAVKSQDLCGGMETMIPKRGRRDVAIHSMKVEPEGAVVEQTHNSLLIIDGSPVSEKVKLELPSSFVLGSQKAFISVCGDMMGPSMGNIGDLLKMSYGCGEQNMVLFAPNIYILGYLKKAKQETPTLVEKGKDMLEKGYIRQLTYKHPDGSYSAFGKSDKEGNTWLTAFCIKSFCQANSIIYIDPIIIKQGMDYMKAQQMSDGCFKSTGRLLNNGMKGGVDDARSLTAYVIGAFLESGLKPNDPVVEGGKKCMMSTPLDDAPSYQLALMAYTMTLAEDWEKRAVFMQELHKKVIRADGLMYLTQEAKPHSESYWSKPKSVDVEMTAYLLLAMACSEKPTKKELGDMAAIIRWLSKQQNSNGGFCSTQDTVVALQAMAKFASLTTRESGAVDVDVTTENGFSHRFHVDNGNGLLLQKCQLPEVPGDYMITASGSGTVMMQVIQVHNVMPSPKDDAFALSAKCACVGSKSDVLQLMLEFCYKGERNATNMVMLEVCKLSGHEVDEESLTDLQKNPMVKRVEKGEENLSIYLDKVTPEPQTLEIRFGRKVPVSGLKDANIHMFDYYLPGEQKMINYLHSC